MKNIYVLITLVLSLIYSMHGQTTVLFESGNGTGDSLHYEDLSNSNCNIYSFQVSGTSMNYEHDSLGIKFMCNGDTAYNRFYLVKTLAAMPSFNHLYFYIDYTKNAAASIGLRIAYEEYCWSWSSHQGNGFEIANNFTAMQPIHYEPNAADSVFKILCTLGYEATIKYIRVEGSNTLLSISESNLDLFKIGSSENNLTIYPVSNLEYRYEVFDISGRLIVNGESSAKRSINIYEKGIFLVRITQGENTITKKVVLE